MAAVTTKTFEIDTFNDIAGKTTKITIANAKTGIDADALETANDSFAHVGYTIIRGRYITKTVDDYVVL